MSTSKKTASRERQRVRRHRRVRKKVLGTPERLRLVIHRSNKNMQGHLVNDFTGQVLLGASTLAPELAVVRADEESDKTALCRAAGKLLAERAQAAGVSTVVFDRGGCLYHGRVAAFAQGAREGGLKF